jgi:hypothetical protein
LSWDGNGINQQTTSAGKKNLGKKCNNIKRFFSAVVSASFASTFLHYEVKSKTNRTGQNKQKQ